MTLNSYDNVPIHYEVIGNGPPILLLHGFGNDSTMWASSGWTIRLQSRFTVITMDFRGCGESGKPTRSAAYSLPAHCTDIESVLAVTDNSKPAIWGWSLGATVALHYAKNYDPRAVIAAGTYFGPIFTDAYVAKRLGETNDEVNRQRLFGMKEWPNVYPGDLKRSYLVYSGTNDGNVVIQLREQSPQITASGGTLAILEDADHMGLVTDHEKVAELVMPFLFEHR